MEEIIHCMSIVATLTTIITTFLPIHITVTKERPHFWVKCYCYADTCYCYGGRD